MPLAVRYDPAETTHDAFVGRDLVVPGRCNVAVNEEVDTCDASNPSHIPNRHRGCDLVTVRRRIAGSRTIFDPIDLECWPGQKSHEEDEEDERRHDRQREHVVARARRLL